MKSLKTVLVLAALSLALTGCQLGVLSMDIGMGFDAGSYVVSDTAP